MNVHIEPMVFLIRFFDGDNSYIDRNDYVAVATITKMDEKGYIQGMHGEIHKTHYAKMFEEVAKIGIKFLHAERKGKERMWNVEKMNRILNPVLGADNIATA
jgi:hypothetical protein